MLLLTAVEVLNLEVVVELEVYCRRLGYRLDTLLLGLVSTKACEALAVLRLVVEGLELQVHVLESLALLVVPVLELVVGLVPRVVAVSLVQYRAHGFPDWSPATWMQGTAPGRCWIDTEL